MRVLIACEFSGVVRDAFTRRWPDWDVWSCDLLPTEQPGKHIQGDVLNVLNDGWDLMIAHPPCTYLCSASNYWINKIEGNKEKRDLAVQFVIKLWEANIKHIAIENPIGILKSRFKSPSQKVYAWHFGHQYSKDICLWLNNLPLLYPTKLVAGPYKTLDFWSTNRITTNGGYKKSITFTGVAEAMAEQWGTFLTNAQRRDQ